MCEFFSSRWDFSLALVINNLVLFVMQDIKLWRYVGGEVQTSKILVGIIHIRQEAGLFHHITPVSSEAGVLDRPHPQA